MDDELDNVFDDHPSLSASLEDFAATCTNHIHRPPLFDIPSQHSGFRSDESDGEDETTPSGEPWSPPGLRRHDYVPGSGWYRHQPYLRREVNNRLDLRPTLKDSPSQSREPSPQYEDAPEAPSAGESKTDIADITLPVKMPLPAGTDAPLKARSPSPNRVPRGGNEGEGVEFGTDTLSNCNALLFVPFPRGVD